MMIAPWNRWWGVRLFSHRLECWQVSRSGGSFQTLRMDLEDGQSIWEVSAESIRQGLTGRWPWEPVAVFIPPQWLILRKGSFPTKDRRKITQAAPFALEPELPLPLDQWFFALEGAVEAAPSEGAPRSYEALVTALPAVWHEGLREALRRWNLESALVTTGFGPLLNLSRMTSGPHLWVEETPEGIHALLCDDGQVRGVNTLSRAALGGDLSQALRLTGTSMVSGLGERRLGGVTFLSAETPCQWTGEDPWAECQAGASTQSFQHPWPYAFSAFPNRHSARLVARKHPLSLEGVSPRTKGVWAAMALVGVGFWGYGEFGEARRLNQWSQELQRQTEAVFRSAFPEVSRLVNPVRQAEIQVRERKQAGGTGNHEAREALDLLQRVSQVFPNQPDAVLRNFKHDGENVTLAGTVATLKDLDALKTALGEAPETSAIQVEKAEVAGSAVEFQLQWKIKTQ